MKSLFRRLEKIEKSTNAKEIRFIVYFRENETEKEAIERALKEDPRPLTRYVIMGRERPKSLDEWERRYGYLADE